MGAARPHDFRSRPSLRMIERPLQLPQSLFCRLYCIKQEVFDPLIEYSRGCTSDYSPRQQTSPPTRVQGLVRAVAKRANQPRTEHTRRSHHISRLPSLFVFRNQK